MLRVCCLWVSEMIAKRGLFPIVVGLLSNCLQSYNLDQKWIPHGNKGCVSINLKNISKSSIPIEAHSPVIVSIQKNVRRLENPPVDYFHSLLAKP